MIGREQELAAVRSFLESDGPDEVLALVGPAGMGKTTIWETGIEDARGLGHTVLQARPSSSEGQLAFAALADLLMDVGDDVLGSLPAPQRIALEVALLRALPEGAPPEPRAIALGLMNALRAIAARAPVLVAIDDVHWLDGGSADAITFAARRLRGDPVRFLFTERLTGASGFTHALEPAGEDRILVGPMSFGAVRQLLADRLGLVLPRRVLRRVLEVSQGNPLFALEIGRLLAETGPPQIGEDIALPELVEGLLEARVARLPSALRRLVLAIELGGGLTTSQLTALVGPNAIDRALDAGVVLVDRDHVRLVHPLLGAAARSQSRAGDRRRMHTLLAGAAADPERRARHLALSSTGPDASLAATVGTAAEVATARGAVEDAVELAEHALRLTPSESLDRPDRMLALAACLTIVGEPDRAAGLLTAGLDVLPSGTPRARAHLLLTEGLLSHVDEYDAHFDRALAESVADPAVRSVVQARRAIHTSVARVERIAEAETWAAEAVTGARGASPADERLALFGLAWPRILRGRSIDGLRRRASELPGRDPEPFRSLDRVAALRHMWRGEIPPARALLDSALHDADERGETRSYVVLQVHRCELELRAGRWDAAEQILDEWSGSSEAALLLPQIHCRCRALHAAGRGRPDEARRWADEAVERAMETGVRWDLLESQRALGLVALLNSDPVEAADRLREPWEHMLREGVEEPGVFPVAPDLVEALAELGELEPARAVIRRLTGAGRGHPWARTTAARCDAVVRIASECNEEAVAELRGAADGYRRLGLAFDAARSHLFLGRALRRARRWGEARRTLELAVTAFEELGSEGWADLGRRELGRVGARRPRQPGELTPAERRVVELAGAGRSNKEIARSLFVTVNTVERHLSRAYHKLGVRSRAELAHRLATRP